MSFNIAVIAFVILALIALERYLNMNCARADHTDRKDMRMTSTTVTPTLGDLLSQPHARNASGKRMFGDLTLSELRLLDESDLRIWASCALGTIHFLRIDLARERKALYLERRDHNETLYDQAERDLKYANMENRGERTDALP